ncbi:MAG: TonB-dependent receptor plug domain-containing protein [Treponema sp.]|jgi:hypothetical protein|nr:TonB-dependent receptor plug domain-containing protein [Treponema sp.]
MPYIFLRIRHILRFMPFILFFILAVHSLYARDITIIVEDIELDMPLEGAIVRVEGGASGGAEKATDEDGKAVFAVPDNRQVRLQIAYPGYENAIFIAPPAAPNATEDATFTVGLRLSGGADLENRELVIEAQRPGASETKTGRSVAISGDDLARTAEIGVIEDVMTSIKLLPGVGYTGMFNAMPSIRGGEPGDLTAVFDGFYIENPYHWGGGVSIFDPRMVQSAQLSHGVFSARYGHTISGLLEITGRKPEPFDVELELGLSSSAANLNVSYPLFGKGGVMIMGKATYWDPFVSLAKLAVDEVNYIKIAPYIRSAGFGANYRFTQNLEWTMFGFIGGDGVGAFYNNPLEYDGMAMHTNFDFEWFNLQGFLITGLIFNPKPDMALKASFGGGFLRTNLHGFIDYDLTAPYSDDFLDLFENKTILYPSGVSITDKTYTVDTTMFADMVDTTANYQARTDYDWDVGKGFLFAAGVQGLYARYALEEHDQAVLETSGAFLTFNDGTTVSTYPAYYNMPYTYNNSIANQSLTTSAYSLLEYASPKKRFGGELGFRLDHLLFIGKDFTLQTLPSLNPRLNLDWHIARNAGVFDSITATIGSGLFSSITDNISSIQSEDGVDALGLKQNRSWTSIAGIKLDFLGFSVNVEGYYKYVFDRAYSTLVTDSASQTIVIERKFDGEGRIWGVDFMLQKANSRYWDGWISYSFNWARYRNPSSSTYTADWFYPEFHRFHNLNLVLNIKPLRSFTITTRFGFASGAPKTVVGGISWYPVIVLDENKMLVDIIQKYKRENFYSDTERDGFALTWDVKASFFAYSRPGRGQIEVYIAIENILATLETRRRNTSFNSYTGKEDQGSNAASYQLPIPMLSIGFRWTY